MKGFTIKATEGYNLSFKNPSSLWSVCHFSRHLQVSHRHALVQAAEKVSRHRPRVGRHQSWGRCERSPRPHRQLAALSGRQRRARRASGAPTGRARLCSCAGRGLELARPTLYPHRRPRADRQKGESDCAYALLSSFDDFSCLSEPSPMQPSWTFPWSW